MNVGEARYFDRAGEPIELFDWAAKFEDDMYPHVASTTLRTATELGDVWVSTRWFGVDMSLVADEPGPSIFETSMCAGLTATTLSRYATEEQARAGHDRHVTAARAQFPDAVTVEDDRC